MIDEGDCGAIGGMKIGRGNRSTWRKPASAPLCPPQIPHDLKEETNSSAKKILTNREPKLINFKNLMILN
jgi:hypothetical protein